MTTLTTPLPAEHTPSQQQQHQQKAAGEGKRDRQERPDTVSVSPSKGVLIPFTTAAHFRARPFTTLEMQLKLCRASVGQMGVNNFLHGKNLWLEGWSGGQAGRQAGKERGIKVGWQAERKAGR